MSFFFHLLFYEVGAAPRCLYLLYSLRSRHGESSQKWTGRSCGIRASQALEVLSSVLIDLKAKLDKFWTCESFPSDQTWHGKNFYLLCLSEYRNWWAEKGTLITLQEVLQNSRFDFILEKPPRNMEGMKSRKACGTKSLKHHVARSDHHRVTNTWHGRILAQLLLRCTSMMRLTSLSKASCLAQNRGCGFTTSLKKSLDPIWFLMVFGFKVCQYVVTVLRIWLRRRKQHLWWATWTSREVLRNTYWNNRISYKISYRISQLTLFFDAVLLVLFCFPFALCGTGARSVSTGAWLHGWSHPTLWFGPAGCSKWLAAPLVAGYGHPSLVWGWDSLACFFVVYECIALS